MTPADALRLMAGRIEAGQIPAPSPAWPLVFHASDEDQARAIAASLGVSVEQVLTGLDDEGWPWAEIRGNTGGVPVRITADAGAVVLDPLTDDGIVESTYAGVAS
jgi:hypothetical protein